MTDRSLQSPPPVPELIQSKWDTIEKRDVLGYDADTGTYLASFDSEKETICEVIIAVVAVVSETPPLELPPLPPVIDTDAVESLVEVSTTGPSHGDIHVSFTFADCEVTVHSYGIITVQPLNEEVPD